MRAGSSINRKTPKARRSPPTPSRVSTNLTRLNPIRVSSRAFTRRSRKRWRPTAQPSSEHAPGPRGSPHEPHGASSGTDFAAPKAVGALAENTESCLSRLVLRHEGHSGTIEPRTRTSKPLRHSLQTYSYIGIHHLESGCVILPGARPYGNLC